MNVMEKMFHHKEKTRKVGQNNWTIALNVLFIENNNQEIRPAYISKHKSKCKKKLYSNWFQMVKNDTILQWIHYLYC